MRHTHKFSLLLASILLASATLAQTNNPSDADASTEGDSIAAARTRYAQTASAQQDDSNDGTLAQFSQPGRFPRRSGYPRQQSYQTQWMDHGNARHVLIGAAIGFGIGAALGASHSAHNGTPVGGGVLIGGGIFGFIGGAIGSGFGGSHPFAHRRRGLPMPGSEDEEANRDANFVGPGAKSSSAARSAQGHLRRWDNPSMLPSRRHVRQRCHSSTSLYKTEQFFHLAMRSALL
jgi:hypothetical protein